VMLSDGMAFAVLDDGAPWEEVSRVEVGESGRSLTAAEFDRLSAAWGAPSLSTLGVATHGIS
jgi:hypothetical protein